VAVEVGDIDGEFIWLVGDGTERNGFGDPIGDPRSGIPVVSE
jgi:hypothetical protein